MKTWGDAIRIGDKVLAKYGSTIYDYSCGENWDYGQAICREQFGVDWMNDPEFRRIDDNDLPPPAGYFEAAQRMIDKTPEWAMAPTKKNQKKAKRK